MNEMTKCPEKIALLHNKFLANKIARETQSRFIKGWEGTFLGAKTFSYLTTHKEFSLKEILRLFTGREQMPVLMMQVIYGVEQLHSLGLVHRTLRPDVIFQSKDPHRPFFIGALNIRLKSPIIRLIKNPRHTIQD
jgi:serine/threonine protein kinase